ncbi:MAG: TetR/AcrR family transcriptional regulator [Citromicrobium sp.]|nr:MAG: TetR/AcrR family transcriptional regulator [Citromicrobium sp.]
MKNSGRLDKSSEGQSVPVVAKGRYAKSSVVGKKTTRRKRSGDEAREESIVAARSLLLEGGPGAVTVSNVGQRAGMSHGNIIHHFGSAAGLQASLMGTMVDDLTEALESAVEQIREDTGAQKSVVDQVFDAFDSGGAGQLAAWIVLARDFEHLEPIRNAVQSLVAAFTEKISGPHAEERVKGAVLTIAISAFGDAVIGPHLREMLDLKDDEMRKLTSNMIPLLISMPR